MLTQWTPAEGFRIRDTTQHLSAHGHHLFNLGGALPPVLSCPCQAQSRLEARCLRQWCKRIHRCSDGEGGCLGLGFPAHPMPVPGLSWVQQRQQTALQPPDLIPIWFFGRNTLIRETNWSPTRHLPNSSYPWYYGTYWGFQDEKDRGINK